MFDLEAGTPPVLLSQPTAHASVPTESFQHLHDHVRRPHWSACRPVGISACSGARELARLQRARPHRNLLPHSGPAGPSNAAPLLAPLQSACVRGGLARCPRALVGPNAAPALEKERGGLSLERSPPRPQGCAASAALTRRACAPRSAAGRAPPLAPPPPPSPPTPSPWQSPAATPARLVTHPRDKRRCPRRPRSNRRPPTRRPVLAAAPPLFPLRVCASGGAAA